MIKDIIGYEGTYSIDDEGNIHSNYTRNRKAKENDLVKKWTSNIGYVYVKLHKNGKTKSFLVHRLVAQHFLMLPERKYEVNHKDGNKQNNRAGNLEWCNHRENVRHAYDTGLHKLAAKMEWWTWTPEQLAAFEASPYNIPACGPYEYPPDLSDRIKKIEALTALTPAVSF